MMRLLSVALMAVAAVGAPVHAQTYPSKPIRLIVPFTPGGGTDFVSRLVALELGKSTGWTIIVENKAGAGGTIGLVEAARANHEGYDIVMRQADNQIIAPAIQKSIPIDPIKDLTPVVLVASSPFLLMTEANSKYKTLADVIARLNTEIRKVMLNPEVRKVLIAQGVEARTSTPEEFGAMLKSETAKWHKIIENAGIKPE